MLIGETLAIATVCCWTLSIQFFGAASKLVGCYTCEYYQAYSGYIVVLNFSFRKRRGGRLIY